MGRMHRRNTSNRKFGVAIACCAPILLVASCSPRDPVQELAARCEAGSKAFVDEGAKAAFLQSCSAVGKSLLYSRAAATSESPHVVAATDPTVPKTPPVLEPVTMPSQPAVPQVEAQAEKLVVRCTSKDQADVVLGLDSKIMMGRVVSCISAPFVFDMTPCAPNGAWSLSYPTGSAGLRAFADRWQDYSDHDGGVTYHTRDSATLVFSGAFNSPDHTTENLWKFEANRLTGNATLKERGKPEVAYMCTKVAPKF
jgi:hypothetical protein